ncbi:MAG TPA: ABC transporter ATP-binding protein [Candidatus Hydrogenedentes bacterium]|nr:ABC transporter ATP-binding protein [Candidatus Hydrogenedentota bacterium]HPC14938.1 ABC transporter ATP-binding protein [Candidatus Hydrogenedentota bacterium]HRT18802.1 ABC transporter ATP-binding protein [Candidatus Hydrogenedentota bacterium]HRT65752.1 ABC transporter ATP-binding protein [Candidatus Hydrogenedentota bacterium]
MNAISARGLTKIYPRQLGRKAVPSLDHLDLDVGENEVFGFIGRNGAGKTTTIKLICGLIFPTAGEVKILGRVARDPGARRAIGYLPENPYYYEYLTPVETLDFYGQLNGLDASGRLREWDKLSELLDLRDIARERIRGFSKGMRQRLAFAVALVGDPRILILDEPMSGLDPIGRRATRELILRLKAEKKTVFFSTHVLSDVEQICDRVGVLVKGRLKAQGRLDELLKRHVRHVEVIATGPMDVPEPPVRISEAGSHFHAPDLESANALVKRIHQTGGHLVEFNPIRESLEDYFVQRQED